LNFNTKVALVTGGNRGIGKSIVEELLNNGVFVIFTYNNHVNEANYFLKEKINYQNYLDSYRINLQNIKAIDIMVEKILKKYNKIDILINNAAISQEKPFEEISINDLNNMFDINFKSAFYLTQNIVPLMKKNQWGRIINIVSIGGQWGGFNQVHYAASKAALINFTQSIAKIYSAYGITSNAVSPGLVETDMSAKELQTNAGKEKLNNIPIGRIAKPVEVAKVVAFLASEDSSYITGQTINVNGGMYFG
jgi:acetoacetyl-CoA reductase/3-oxoacyl-[acyl-carrier protein] reductase